MKQLLLMTHFLYVVLTSQHRYNVRATTLPPAPLCFLRAGQEFMFRFKRPSNVVASESKHTYLQWKNNVGRITKASRACLYSKREDQFFCPTPLNVYNEASLKNTISQLKAVNSITNQTIWNHQHSFVPSNHLFDCISNHNVRGIQLQESNAHKWVLSWRRSPFSKCFKPRYEITVAGTNEASITPIRISKCKQTNNRCRVTFPDDVRQGDNLKKVCITSIFVLDLKNYYTITTKRFQLCTVSNFRSKYRLKVVNTNTGKVVEDYGIWHHPMGGGSLNKTTLAKVKKTKEKVVLKWKVMKGTKKPRNLLH